MVSLSSETDMHYTMFVHIYNLLINWYILKYNSNFQCFWYFEHFLTLIFDKTVPVMYELVAIMNNYALLFKKTPGIS